MQIIDTCVENVMLEYPLEEISSFEKILFLDIETTGFTAKTSKLYLIGCLYFDGTWKAKQFFSDKENDETELIREFFKFSQNFETLIHFNGNNFDLPFILGRCKEYDLSFNFNAFNGIDIYRRIFPYKQFLKLDNCKQKTIEKFLKIDREDQFSGGELINVYLDYLSTKDSEKKGFLLLHNFEDLKGMLYILPALAYADIFTRPLTVTKVSASYFNDLDGDTHSEVTMILDLPNALKTPISFMYDRCYFSAAGTQGMLKVPLYEEEMKFFYANYKEYYYLPYEDIALHKSVATFVDKDHREQAKATNCYTKKSSKFLPEWDIEITPFFKRDYNSKELFFELTDERKTDRNMFSKYASHVLNHMIP